MFTWSDYQMDILSERVGAPGTKPKLRYDTSPDIYRGPGTPTRAAVLCKGHWTLQSWNGSRATTIPRILTQLEINITIAYCGLDSFRELFELDLENVREVGHIRKTSACEITVRS
jgi:hypothetical protein